MADEKETKENEEKKAEETGEMNELKKFMRNIIKVIMKGSRKKMDFIIRKRLCNFKLTVKTR